MWISLSDLERQITSTWGINLLDQCNSTLCIPQVVADNPCLALEKLMSNSVHLLPLSRKQLQRESFKDIDFCSSDILSSHFFSFLLSSTEAYAFLSSLIPVLVQCSLLTVFPSLLSSLPGIELVLVPCSFLPTMRCGTRDSKSWSPVINFSF